MELFVLAVKVVANKIKSPKNENKKIITAFLGENKNINWPYEECMTKFFAIEKNRIIRKDAFRFYYKKVKDGTIAPEKIIPEKVIIAETKKELKPVASKPAIKPPTKAAVKAAVKKTKVVKAAKI